MNEYSNVFNGNNGLAMLFRHNYTTFQEQLNWSNYQLVSSIEYYIK